jgi:3-methyladenine DNA glycosylase/8-oxoguanine DNA glycosylase
VLDVRVEVRPRWPFRLPRRNGLDGVVRCRGGVVQRLLHVGDEAVVVRVAQLAPDRVLFGAQAQTRPAAKEAIARMRFALGVDDDLRPFHERFRFDPLIGAALRRRPDVRVGRRAEPFEALAWAVTEQLIEIERAGAIQRRIVATLGVRCPRTGLRDVPSAAVVAGTAPALLQSFDLAAGRALALVRAAREVARGRVDLHGDHERGWRRLRAIPGIGAWTIELLALQGQGRHDQVPAGDLNLIKLVGRARSGGDPHARATEDEVREAFAPYAPWGGLAATYAMRLGLAVTAPVPAGTRWSASAARRAA